MNLPDPLPATPRGSSLEGLVAAAAALYARLEADQRDFLDRAAARGTPLVCPPGCSSCCEPFVPDILPSEAVFIAAWLLERQPGLAEEAASWFPGNGPSAPPCPFLRPCSKAPCAIYPVRPLVCRLFGAAGVRDREGLPTFRPCARMSLAGYPPVGAERPAITGEALSRGFGSQPPIMADYSAELAALCPSDAERSLLTIALPAALARLSLSLSLAQASPRRTYSKA